jgi:hypothetical protein
MHRQVTRCCLCAGLLGLAALGWPLPAHALLWRLGGAVLLVLAVCVLLAADSLGGFGSSADRARRRSRSRKRASRAPGRRW